MNTWKHGTNILRFGDYIESVHVVVESSIQVLIWNLLRPDGSRASQKWTPAHNGVLRGLDITQIVGETVLEVKIEGDRLTVHFISGRWFCWDCAI